MGWGIGWRLGGWGNGLGFPAVVTSSHCRCWRPRQQQTASRLPAVVGVLANNKRRAGFQAIDGRVGVVGGDANNGNSEHDFGLLMAALRQSPGPCRCWRPRQQQTASRIPIY